MRQAPKAAAIYLRISSDPLDDTLGVKRQETDCIAEAARRGWTVSEIYTDDDRSAFSGKPRPDYLCLVANVRLGLHDGIMAWRLDRLHRRMSELEDFISITEQAGVALATVTGDVDISTAPGD